LAVGAIVAGIAASTLAAGPANAAGSCTAVDFDNSTGYATARCSGGPGAMYFTLTCLTLAGLFDWDDESGRIEFGSSANVVHKFSTCGGWWSSLHAYVLP
jgi:hypothetical protein